MSFTVSYRETIAIRSFLGYLHQHYSKSISTTDTYLIAAVAAWYYAKTNGGKAVQYNNPFQLRAPSTSRIVIDEDTGNRRVISVAGKLLRFKTLAEGFIFAAKSLMQSLGGNSLVLNALKRGGNQAAVDFLAALAMSRWDVAFGASNWQDAYSADKNKLIGFYLNINGVQLLPRVRPRPPQQPHRLVKDYYYTPITRAYLDPWAANAMYRSRHHALTRNLATGGRRG